MKRLLMICLLLFCMGADEITPEPPIEEPEITAEPIEPTPEPVIVPEVIPEIPPEPTPEPALIQGCTDPQAANYLPAGEGYIVISGECIYFEGCMDKRALNYADAAVKDDGSCMYLTGCTDTHAVNYVDYSAYGLYLYADDGSCVYMDGYIPDQPEEQPEEVAEFAIFAEPDIIADCLTTDGERICL